MHFSKAFTLLCFRAFFEGLKKVVRFLFWAQKPRVILGAFLFSRPSRINSRKVEEIRKQRRLRRREAFGYAPFWKSAKRSAADNHVLGTNPVTKMTGLVMQVANQACLNKHTSIKKYNEIRPLLM